MADGMILWEGASRIDGAPIVCIATGFKRKTANKKLSDSDRKGMIQTWIMRSDIPPHEAIKTGQDESVCGGCIHRRANGGACYVLAYQAPLSIFKAYHRGGYQHALNPCAVDRDLRLGAYGNPSAIPASVWSMHTTGTRMITGYDHQWRDLDPSIWARFVMASVETPEDAIRAHALGWRTFRVKLPEDPLLPFERGCPASEEMGKILDCQTCAQCDGTRQGARRPSRAINVHGSLEKHYRRWRAGLAERVDFHKNLAI
jgi:hypothetical protein